MYKFEVVDLTTNKSFEFDAESTLILGRGDPFGIQDRTVSRKQVQLEALRDGRCFAERLSENPSLLGTKLLPLKHKVEVSHKDIISLLPGKFPFQINFPHHFLEGSQEDTQPLSNKVEPPVISDTESPHDEAESHSSDQEDIDYTIESGHPDGLSFSEESSYLGEVSDATI
ncbi:hypothetical protein K450DRAFT_274885 [Umbelopsis ramanniana AG]|uniref:PNK FHA domain-containing protein n=1 Tax=Umbelopsis ramanniana AG TaxID=1314678 RepID=A0AAD5E450_UMBRA|nr:uncharacterized protein K450DRAFT_274885 [Umbelopsis ramanniana AG]KAI8576319.1 hypothetical protein K450DRAFT_274885 [Umbelopsis ramanniana AG]